MDEIQKFQLVMPDSTGWVGVWVTKSPQIQHRIQWLAKKHEIYVAAFGSHLFYDLFLQGLGGAMAPSAPPESATEIINLHMESKDFNKFKIFSIFSDFT